MDKILKDLRAGKTVKCTITQCGMMRSMLTDDELTRLNQIGQYFYIH